MVLTPKLYIIQQKVNTKPSDLKCAVYLKLEPGKGCLFPINFLIFYARSQRDFDSPATI